MIEKKTIIKIHNIEKQICFNNLKKESLRKIVYTRKLITKFAAKGATTDGGTVNIPI